MPDQIRRALRRDTTYSRPRVVGFRLAALVEAADAAAGSSAEIREQDLVAALVAIARDSIRACLIDPDRLLDRVRAIEGVGALAPTVEERRADEVDALAGDLIRRLEASEPLGAILPAARRLAELRHLRGEALWLQLEIMGSEHAPPPQDLSDEQRAAVVRHAVLHRTFDLPHVDFDPVEIMRRPPERKMIDRRSVMQLERSMEPAALSPASRSDPDQVRPWGWLMVAHTEALRILDLVRSEVHGFAVKCQAQIRHERRLLELFGSEALIVFSVGGTLLDQLGVAIDDLDRAGGYPTAALAARTTVLTLGRELYAGPDQFTSPKSGETFATDRGHEKNRLRARLHGLWQMEPSRRPLLEAAEVALDEAYELGSRAKDPSAITYEQALQAVRDAYAVARALALSGALSR